MSLKCHPISAFILTQFSLSVFLLDVCSSFHFVLISRVTKIHELFLAPKKRRLIENKLMLLICYMGPSFVKVLLFCILALEGQLLKVKFTDTRNMKILDARIRPKTIKTIHFVVSVEFSLRRLSLSLLRVSDLFPERWLLNYS